MELCAEAAAVRQDLTPSLEMKWPHHPNLRGPRADTAGNQARLRGERANFERDL
jgi:hypothetical protein